MDIEEVPQDNSSTYAGHKKVLYARSKAGEYTCVQSSGWDAEADATKDAVALYEGLAAEALLAVKSGTKSPLFFHMYDARMDLLLLSQVTGLWRWRIKRHFNTLPLTKLSNALLQRYADALDMPIEQLTQIPASDL